MSNYNNIPRSYEIDKMIRPREIFISSDYIAEHDSASQIKLNFQENIVTSEGFHFAFGLSSIGFNTTVFNISEHQSNNKLIYSVSYYPPLYIPDQYDNETGEYTYIKNPEVWSFNDDGEDEYLLNSNTLITEDYTVTIPDGYYNSLDDLFTVLNDELCVYISSKYKCDINKTEIKYPSYFVKNDINITLYFSSLSNGYRIWPYMGKNINSVYQTNQTFKNYYVDALEPSKGYPGYYVNNILSNIKIKPYPDNILYNILFTNINSTKNTPPQAPSFLLDTGLVNPPTSIVFEIQCYFGLESIDPNDPKVEGETTDIEKEISEPSEYIEFIAYGEPNSNLNQRISNLSDSVIPSKYRNYPYVSYFKPRLNPYFIDIETDLPTNNITETGTNRNILKRQFIPANSSGITDFYQEFSNPIWYTTANHSLNSIHFHFVSESNKWNFFNLQFTIGLILFEYPIEAEPSNFNEVPFSLPANDITTAYFNNYIGPPNNIHVPDYDPDQRGILAIRDSSKKLKRLRK